MISGLCRRANGSNKSIAHPRLCGTTPRASYQKQGLACGLGLGSHSPARIKWNKLECGSEAASHGFAPRSSTMATYVLHVGAHTAQGVRSNNEDRLVVDPVNKVFLVADGMGGQDKGEQASGLAAEIIPRVVQDRLAAEEDALQAVQRALNEANQAIIHAGRNQPAGRRTGTTAVLADQQATQF